MTLRGICRHESRTGTKELCKETLKNNWIFEDFPRFVLANG